MSIDAQRVLEIRASPARMLLLGAAALVMAAGSVLMARAYAHTGSYREFIGWVGAVFFGAGFLLVIWRAVQGAAQPLVTLSPQGVRDIRISPEFIPWTAVQQISTWRYRNTKAAVVKVPEDIWRDFPLSRMARWSRSANTSLGVDGLAIGTVELKMKADELLDAMTTYARAHGSTNRGAG